MAEINILTKFSVNVRLPVLETNIYLAVGLQSHLITHDIAKFSNDCQTTQFTKFNPIKLADLNGALNYRRLCLESF